MADCRWWMWDVWHIRHPQSAIRYFLALVLFRFALDADTGPGNGFQAGGSDFIFAILADAVSALINAMDRIFDGAEELVVRLFQCEPDVQIVFQAGLVN